MHWTAGFRHGYHWPAASDEQRCSMFILADSHSFPADPEACSLWAGYGYGDESLSWKLRLHSKNKRIRLRNETEEASFGISLHPPLGTQDWRRLHESQVELSPERLACSFYFHFGCYGEWEDLLGLDLRFGDSCGGRVEVWARGSGSVEAAQDLFPHGQVGFQVHTWVSFCGVAINVPLNASDPIPYSAAQVRALLPQYAFSPPVLRTTNDEAGVVRAVEVLFAPHA
jgi:hypothetical protein